MPAIEEADHAGTEATLKDIPEPSTTKPGHLCVDEKDYKVTFDPHKRTWVVEWTANLNGGLSGGSPKFYETKLRPVLCRKSGLMHMKRN